MIRSFFSNTYQITRDAIYEFIDDEAITRAGALAFFGIFSIPPLIIIVLNGVSFFAGTEVANSELFGQIKMLWGERIAGLVQNLITSYSIDFQQQQSSFRSIVGIAVFLVSATSFFLYIQYSLNSIWDIKAKPRSTFLNLLKNRMLSLGIILVIIALILLSVLLDSFLLFMSQWMIQVMSVDQLTTYLFSMFGSLLSYLLVLLIIVFIFKFLPNVSMRWEVVFTGAALSSLLFGLGKLVIGFLLSYSDIEGTYGIVGSLILVMLWVYYSAAILYFGAELTQQYGIFRSKEIRPGKNAVKVVTKETREQQE